MFTSLTESLFGSPTSPKVKSTSNITTRGKRTATSTNTNGASGNSNSLLTSKSTSSLTVAEQTKAHELLKNEIKFKDAAITALTAKVLRLEDEIRSANFSKGIKKKAHPISAVSNIINDNGRQRVKVGTRGSLCTQNILEAINEPVKTQAHFLAEKFVNIFQNPLDYIHYLQSSQFATELISVCNAVIELLEEEPRVLFMQSPVYVFGDIHGNLEDLHFFADNIWKLGMDLTAGQFLFLGKITSPFTLIRHTP